MNAFIFDERFLYIFNKNIEQTINVYKYVFYTTATVKYYLQLFKIIL